MTFWQGILIGWSAGFGACWLYFHKQKLIRSKREWMLRDALACLYQETADYVLVNHLGDTHHNHSMRKAREALNQD